MGLFDFFKRKEEINFSAEKELGKVLNSGVYFEDTDDFLKWGVAIKDLAKYVTVKEKIFADRSVYSWGEHSILNGLTLDFTTVCWNHKQEGAARRFNSIEFQAVGDDIEEKYVDTITAHIEKIFGKANEKVVGAESVTLEWIINDARIYLYFFEQYGVKKLQFEISSR
jgi:hypothetical protein